MCLTTIVIGQKGPMVGRSLALRKLIIEVCVDSVWSHRTPRHLSCQWETGILALVIAHTPFLLQLWAECLFPGYIQFSDFLSLQHLNNFPGKPVLFIPSGVPGSLANGQKGQGRELRREQSQTKSHAIFSTWQWPQQPWVFLMFTTNLYSRTSFLPPFPSSFLYSLQYLYIFPFFYSSFPFPTSVIFPSFFYPSPSLSFHPIYQSELLLL